MSHTETTLTKRQILNSRIALGAGVLLLGLFLLLCGVDAIHLRPLRVLAPAVLATAAAVCFAWAFIQDNALMLWLSMPLLFSALACILVIATPYGFGAYYPLFIVSPAAGSIVVAAYENKWRDQIKIITLFAVSAAIFALNSALGVSLAIVIPIFVIFAGAVIIIGSAMGRKE